MNFWDLIQIFAVKQIDSQLHKTGWIPSKILTIVGEVFYLWSWIAFNHQWLKYQRRFMLKKSQCFHGKSLNRFVDREAEARKRKKWRKKVLKTKTSKRKLIFPFKHFFLSEIWTWSARFVVLRSRMEINHGNCKNQLLWLGGFSSNRCDMFWEVFFISLPNLLATTQRKFPQTFIQSLLLFFVNRRINNWHCTHENDLLKQNRFLSFFSKRFRTRSKANYQTFFALHVFQHFFKKSFSTKA